MQLIRLYLVRHGHVDYFDAAQQPINPKYAPLSVQGEQQIALLCHISSPTETPVMPTCFHIAQTRNSVHVYDGGIFLRRIEIGGFYHTVIQVGDAVGSLHRAARVFGNSVPYPRIFGFEILHVLCRGCIDDVDVARYIGRGVIIHHPFAGW